jgi:hypothetical protein
MSGRLKNIFGPGRTSFARGLAGIFTASILTFLFIPFPLFASILWDDLRQGGKSAAQITAFQILGYSFLMVLVAVVLFGVLIWALLRALQRESSRAYAAAGCIGGILAGIHFGHVRLIGMTPSEAVIVAACLFAGGVGALSFWLIARTRPSIEARLGPLQSS